MGAVATADPASDVPGPRGGTKAKLAGSASHLNAVGL